MISKRNFKMYIKQKSTITAFLFFVLFLIMLIISVLPACKYRKGVYDEFQSYDITYMSTNNYNVTYLASGNELFYSQNVPNLEMPMFHYLLQMVSILLALLDCLQLCFPLLCDNL